MDYLYSFIFPYLNYYLDIILLCKINCQKAIKTYFPEPDYSLLNATLFLESNPRTSHNVSHYFEPYSENIIQWDEILEDMMNEWDMGDLEKMYLEIEYTMLGKVYTIIYHYQDGDNIVFPPHTVEDVRKYAQSGEYRRTILSAELCNGGGEIEPEDITNVVRKYAGPMGDFHGCELYHRHLGYCDDNGNIIRITDSTAEEYIFEKNDRIKLE